MNTKGFSITICYNLAYFFKTKKSDLFLRTHFLRTVQPVYNEHPRDPKIVAAVEWWSLFGGYLCYKRSNWDLIIVVVVDRWSLFEGGRVSSGLTVVDYLGPLLLFRLL